MDTHEHVLTKFKRDSMELMNDIHIQTQPTKKVVLHFTPFKDQYIVSIPNDRQYTFIADSIQDGIDYVKSRKNDISLPQEIDIKGCVSDKADDEIIVRINNSDKMSYLVLTHILAMISSVSKFTYHNNRHNS